MRNFLLPGIASEQRALIPSDADGSWTINFVRRREKKNFTGRGGGKGDAWADNSGEISASLSFSRCVYIYIYIYTGGEREREIYIYISTRPFYRALQHQCIIHSSSLLTIGAHTHAVHRQQLNCGYKTRILHSQMSRILSSKAICCNTFISTSVKLILCLHTPLSYTHTHAQTQKKLN